MNSTISAPVHWPSVWKLVLDYRDRRELRVLLMAAVYFLAAMLVILGRESGGKMIGSFLVMFVFMYGSDYPRGDSDAHHPDARTIRSFPFSGATAAMAAWLQYVGVPLVFCLASCMAVSLLGLLFGNSTGHIMEGTAVYLAAAGLFQSQLAVFMGAPQHFLPRMAVNGKKPWAVAGKNVGFLGGMTVVLCTMLWAMQETNSARFLGIALPASSVFFALSFVFRDSWLIDRRIPQAAMLSQGTERVAAARVSRRWQNRCYPLVSAAGTGLACAAFMAVMAAVAGPSWRSTPDEDFVVILLLLMPVVICMSGNMAILMLWLPAVRACRALPISRERLTLGAMAIQLLSVVPSLLVLGCVTWWLWTRQHVGVSMHTSLSMGLSVEAILLFIYPYNVRSGEGQNKESLVLALLLVVLTGIMIKLAEPSPIMPLLPAAGLVLLTAALVFCYRRLCAFIANDSRVYQKHASPLL